MNKLLVKIAFGSGILTALSCFVLFVVLVALDFKPLEQHQFLYFPLYALGMISAMKYFRDYRNGGLMHGWQGIGMGLIINFFASVFYAGLIYIWLTSVNPQIFENYKMVITEKIDADFHTLETELNKLDRKKPDEAKIYATWKTEIDDYMKLKEVANSLTPQGVAWSVWLRTVGIGMVMGMGIGIFFKQKTGAFLQKISS